MHFDIFNTDAGVTFEVKVQPGAKKTGLAGIWDRALKLKVAKKAEAGAANKECRDYFARRLGVPRRDVCIIKGEFSARKVFLVKGLKAEQAYARLRPDCGAPRA